MAGDGLTPEEIVARLNELTAKVEASFILDRLDYMKKAGAAPRRPRLARTF